MASSHATPLLGAAVLTAALTISPALLAQAPPSPPPPPSAAAKPPPPPAAAQPPPPPAAAQPPPPAGAEPLPPPPAPPPGPGAPPPGYGAPPPGYGAPPPGYGAPPPGYGAPPPGYGAPPPGYGYGPTPVYDPYNQPPPPDAPMKRNSVGMMVGGIVLTSVGAILLGIGGFVYSSSQSIVCSVGSPCQDEQGERAGIILMLSGLAGVGVGIPLIVVGARKVPAQPEPPSAALVLGPGGLSMRGKF